MKDTFICEKCGHEMTDCSSDGSIAIVCPKCGWGWATTTYNPIADDMTDYEIWLSPGNMVTIQSIKLISGILNCNYNHAKNVLACTAPFLLYKAKNESVSSQYKAERVQTVAKQLKEGKISFSILPEFPYEY